MIGNYGAGDEQLERVRKVVDESNERARRDLGEVEAKPPLQAPPGKPEPLPGRDHNVEPDPPADPPADVADPKSNEKGAPLDRGAERPKPARPNLDDLDVAPDPEAGGGPTLSVLAVPRPEEAPPGPSARASAVESRPACRNEVLEALIEFTRAALPAAGPVPAFPLRPPGGAVGADRKALQRLAGTKGKGNRLADLYRVVAQLGRDRSRAFAVPGKDPDGSLTWARMLARARFVAPEAAEPGDLVYLA
ncbi:MAG: hypothetical protein ACLGI3_11910, partial [Actinomycetes bacterium]